MNKKVYKALDETIYSYKHSSGLQVFLLHKENYHKTYVTLTTPFGSNVTMLSNDKEIIFVPLGSAHFLEHQLFEKNGIDISNIFSRQSAQVNAYTMNTRTTYLFSCTDNLWENIKTLLDMVFYPVFTSDSIEKEKGIITQEILMYQDDSSSRAYNTILKQMYQIHPVKNDILGTVESINEITSETLKKVHKIAYNPANMTLFITGNISRELHEKIMNYQLPKAENSYAFITTKEEENSNVLFPHSETEMVVAIPEVMLGIKLDSKYFANVDLLRNEIVGSLYLEMMFGKSSNTYQLLMQEGLINDNFGWNSNIEEEYAYIIVGGQTMAPDKLLTKLKQIIINESISNISDKRYEQLKKAFIGQFVKALNSLEFIANQYPKYHKDEYTLFDVIDITKSITKDELINFEKFLKDESNFTSIIIKPKTTA